MSPLLMRWSLLLVTIGTAASITACTPLPIKGNLPAGITVQKLAATAGGSAAAWSNDGRKIAYLHEGVRVRDLAANSDVLVADAAPVAMAWAPDDRALAVAYAEAGQTRLQLRHMQPNEPVTQILLPGEPSRLFWPGPEIIVCTSKLKRYSFGGNLQVQMVRWDGEAEPRVETLYDTTLKPLTLQSWGGRLPALFADLSPWGDALLYTRLHDPPEFPPYLDLVWRHLDSGTERTLADLNLLSAGARFISGDDRFVVADGTKETRRVDLWHDRVEDVWPAPGTALAVSAGGRSLLLDGQLWVDGTRILTVRDVDQAYFSPDGEQLLLHSGSTLYQLSGLPTDPPPELPVGPALERLKLLRRWRASGLISPEEFQREKGHLP